MKTLIQSLTEALNAEDQELLEELKLFILNDGGLYRSIMIPIIKNLKRKYDKGIYDSNKAPKIFKSLIDRGVKKYNKEIDNETNFSSQIKKQLALELAIEIEQQLKNGEFD